MRLLTGIQGLVCVTSTLALRCAHFLALLLISASGEQLAMLCRVGSWTTLKQSEHKLIQAPKRSVQRHFLCNRTVADVSAQTPNSRPTWTLVLHLKHYKDMQQLNTANEAA